MGACALAAFVLFSPPQAAGSASDTTHRRVTLAQRNLDANTLVVVSAERVNDDPDGAPYAYDRLSVKRRSGHGWRVLAQVQRSERLDRGQDIEGGFCSVELVVGDFDRDGSKEIAVIRNYHFTSGGPPADLRAYRFKGGKLRLLGAIQSNQEIQVKHMGRHGQTQFLNSYEVGYDMGHSEMPRWNDIYEIRGNKLLQVNDRFPAFFSAWLPRLRKVLAWHPVEQDLWAHYGFALAYSKSRVKPAAAYLSVARAARRIAAQPEPEYHEEGYKEKLLDGVRTLVQWARQNRPFPKPIKPVFFFGDYFKDDQSPRAKPPKR